MTAKTNGGAYAAPTTPEEMKALINDPTWMPDAFGVGVRRNTNPRMVTTIWEHAQAAAEDAAGTPVPGESDVQVLLRAAREERDKNKPGSRLWNVKNAVVKAIEAAL